MVTDWMLFPIEAEGKTAFALVDVSVGAEAPIAKLPLLMALRVPMADPGDDGLGSTEEVDAISALEDRLDAALSNAFKARHVARVRGNGAVDLIFYLPRHAKGKAEGVVEKIMEGREYECGVGEDAEWSMYRESLYPTPEQVQWCNDHRLIQHFAATGNDVARSREVEFVAFMPNEERARGFALAAGTRGFTTHAISRSEEAEDFPFTVELKKHSTLDFEEVHASTLCLLELASAHEGIFDGWAAETDTAMDFQRGD